VDKITGADVELDPADAVSLALDPRFAIRIFKTWATGSRKKVYLDLEAAYVHFGMQDMAALGAIEVTAPLAATTTLDEDDPFSVLHPQQATPNSNNRGSPSNGSDDDSTSEDLETQRKQLLSAKLQVDAKRHSRNWIQAIQRIEWSKLVTEYSPGSNPDDWRTWIEVPMKAIVDNMKKCSPKLQFGYYEQMLWWSVHGITKPLASSFSERIASGGAKIVNKDNASLGDEQVLCNATCRMNRKFNREMKRRYAPRLKKKLQQQQEACLR
jgi:hypothetical protein